MRRKLLFVFVLLAGAAAAAQTPVIGPGVSDVTTAPAGSCTSGASAQKVVSTGLIYTCQSGTWGLASSGAVPGGAAGGDLSGTYPNPTVPRLTKILCRIYAPVTNTGSTTRNPVYNCLIPAGTVDSTGTIEVRIGGQGCTASVTPYGGCGGANSGTCSVFAYLSPTASTGQTFGITPSSGAAAAAKGYYVRLTVQAQNSTSAQVSNGSEALGTASLGFNPSLGTINMAADSYLNVFLTNGVAGDLCGVDQVFVTYTP